MRLILAAGILATSTAHAADLPRCSDAPADLAYAATDLGEHSGDTGWFPDGSPAQLRITGLLTGKTTVAMGLQPKACWDDGTMKLVAPGRTDSGLLDAEYGAQLHLYGQIHTSVLGYPIDWSGEIPLHVIPTDLLLADITGFDPPATASAYDTTSPIVLLSTNLLTAIIDITGISGGLDLDVQGAMTTTYSTTAIEVANAPIPTTGTIVPKPDHGFGRTLTMPITATGIVHYEPALVFSVAFDVKILGIRVVNYSLASVTLPLPTIDRPIALTAAAPLSIPLPHLAQVPQTLGFATGAAQTLALHNDGAAPLAIAVSNLPPGVSAQGTTLAPGADGTITVTAADPTVGGSIALVTNDPNYPALSIALDPGQSGQTDTPADPDPESAGCNANNNDASALVLALALVGLLAARRRT